MEEHCVDLEIAKELKENGFPQEDSIMLWRSRDFEYAPELVHNLGYSVNKKDNCTFSKYTKIYNGEDYATHCYSAPTSDELLKKLPFEIMGYVLEIIRYENGTIEADYTRTLPYEQEREYLIQSRRLSYKLSNCLAELWLDLQQEGYINDNYLL